MGLGDFAEQAEAYDRSRPGYPLSMLRSLVEIAGVQPGDTVVDLGAGTGIFTKLLVDQGFRVNAVEPSAAMRQKATKIDATWLAGSFENCPLDDKSQDWAVAAQSFHWANARKALSEISRILRDRSLLTVLWNNRVVDGKDVVSSTEELIKALVPNFEESYRGQDWPSILESTDDFEFIDFQRSVHVVRMSQERYLELWKSHNRLNNIAGETTHARFIKQLAGLLDRLGTTFVEVQYDCQAWSARKKSH